MLKKFIFFLNWHSEGWIIIFSILKFFLPLSIYIMSCEYLYCMGSDEKIEVWAARTTMELESSLRNSKEDLCWQQRNDVLFASSSDNKVSSTYTRDGNGRKKSKLSLTRIAIKYKIRKLYAFEEHVIELTVAMERKIVWDTKVYDIVSSLPG